jgi:hypothetical protein
MPQNLHISDINNKFVKDLIQKSYDNTGTSTETGDWLIATAIVYLRKTERTNQPDSEFGQPGLSEIDRLKEFISKNNLWVMHDPSYNQIGEGGEHVVFSKEGIDYVIKYNNISYYKNSWSNYFINLLLHNKFFPKTRYDLIGFIRYGNELCSVVKQISIEGDKCVDLSKIAKELKGGEYSFVNLGSEYNYFNLENKIAVCDLHDRNVLIKKLKDGKEVLTLWKTAET